jgi:hypothetical protein
MGDKLMTAITPAKEMTKKTLIRDTTANTAGLRTSSAIGLRGT